MKKVLKLKENAILSNGIGGIAWIILGISQTVNQSYYLSIVIDILISAGFFTFIAAYFMKTEKEDEMAIHNRIKAKAKVYDLFLILVLVLWLISKITKGAWMIDLKILTPFIVGGFFIVECIFFLKYEKVGE